MNIIKKNIIAIIASLALLSCSSNEEPLNINNTLSSKKTIETVSIPISLSIDEEDNETRGLMKYSGTKVSFPKEDLLVRVATRVPNVYGYDIVPQTLLFKYENGKYCYDGQIRISAIYKIDSETSNIIEVAAVVLNGGSTEFADLDGYYIERSDIKEVATKKKYYAKEGTDNDIDIEEPSYSEWTKLEYDSTKKIFKKATLHFKSAGTLVGIKFRNETEESVHIKSINIIRGKDTEVYSRWSLTFNDKPMYTTIKQMSSNDEYLTLKKNNSYIHLKPKETTSNTYYIFVASPMDDKILLKQPVEFEVRGSFGESLSSTYISLSKHTLKNKPKLSTRINMVIPIKRNEPVEDDVLDL